MSFSEFRKSGHAPTLGASLLHFDVSFMCWVLIGALAVPISAKTNLNLSDSQTGLMVAVPLLSAAVFRIIFGQMVDRVGARAMGCGMLIALLLPLTLGWQAGTSFGQMLVVGLLLGIAGASFVVALPLASRWYPPKYQGLAMGIAGAGNSGTVIAAFVAPRLVTHCTVIDPSTNKWFSPAACPGPVGQTGLASPNLAGSFTWHEVFGLAIIPVLVVLALFLLIAKEPPSKGAAVPVKQFLGDRDAWKLCAFYTVTFGFFVGMISFGPKFLSSSYDVDMITAGTWIAVGALAGSLLRPLGGALSDKLGGANVLVGIYGLAAALLVVLSAMHSVRGTEITLVLLLATLGFGNGAVFQLVGSRYSGANIGAVTGLVGAAGGIGGFLLPNIMGSGKDLTGSFSAPFAALGAIAALALIGIAASRVHWHGAKSAVPASNEA